MAWGDGSRADVVGALPRTPRLRRAPAEFSFKFSRQSHAFANRMRMGYKTLITNPLRSFLTRSPHRLTVKPIALDLMTREDLWEAWARNGAVPLRVHPSLEPWAHREFLGASTYAAWAAIAVFLASFGVLINNSTRGSEPKVGTCMLAVGFLFLVWSTTIFFYANWPIQHRAAMIALLILMILLMAVIVLAGVRIWTPIGPKPVIAPEPVYVVPPPVPSPSRSSSSSS